MRCPACGHNNPNDLSECQTCGDPIGDEANETGIRPAPVGGDDDVTGLRPSAPPPERVEPDDEAPTGYLPSPVTGAPFRSGTPSGSQTGPSGGMSPGSTGELSAYVSFGNRYEILELLGEGGMGRVYKAWDRELEKVIALKTIRGEKANEPEILKRFKQELLLARKITHKNVIRIHDMGEAEGVRFFTMEYIPGESLKERVQEQGRIAAADAVPMIRQILGALEEAHDQGVVHRDLKPQNIMIDHEGMLHIMDFGIARSAHDTGGMTATGMVMGTPDYMSPEQVRGEKADAQSDLFSFGVILYEMLTGEVPYQGETTASRVMMRLTQKPRPPREIHGDIPKYLEDIVVKCLEVDRALRYKSAAEVLEDIEREQVDRTVVLRVRRAISQRKMGVAALLALAAATSAVGYLLLTGGQGPTSGTPSEEPARTLAILPLTNATGSQELEWMRTGLPEMLMTDISQSRYVRPVPGERVLTVLRDLGIAEHTRFDEASLKSIATMAPAQAVLFGQYIESAGTLRLDLTLRSSETGVPVPLQVEGSSSDIFALVDQITNRVKEHLDLTPDQIRGDTNRPIAEVSSASIEALRTYQAGLAELRQGANQEAIAHFEDATREDPNFVMAHAKLAEAYLSAGQDPQAETAIERAEQLSEEMPIPLVERYQIHALGAQLKNDYETAVRSYSELVKLYPEDPDLQLSLARSYEGQGRLPEAGEAYRRVLEIAPDHAQARFDLAWVLVWSGQRDEGIRLLEEALASGDFKEDPEALGMIHSILGVAFREMGELDQAMEHFGLSLSSRREAGDRRGEAATLSNMGDVYFYRGDTAEAIEAQDEARAIARDIGDSQGESDYLAASARFHKVAGNLDEGLAAYRESLQIETEGQEHDRIANRLDQIADIYRMRGQYEDALIYLDQAKMHLDQSQQLAEKGFNLVSRGLVRKAQGLYEQALEALLAALPLFRESQQPLGEAWALREVAPIYWNQGRYTDAYTSLQKSLEILAELGVESEVAEARTLMGHLLVILGRPDEADKEIAEAERIAREARAQSAMAQILLARGGLARLRRNGEEAAEAFDRAMELAEQTGQKEMVVAAQLERGRLYVERGQLARGKELLVTTKEDAARARLRPLESEAAVALAETYLIEKDAEAARKTALEAISLAERYTGRPTLSRAHAVLGEALHRLGRQQEALDAYAEAASIMDWIASNLPPQHATSFMAKPSVQSFLKKAVEVLESGGSASDVAPLKQWLEPLEKVS